MNRFVTKRLFDLVFILAPTITPRPLFYEKTLQTTNLIGKLSNGN